MYDAAIVRFHTIDPLAEKYAPISPYAYVANSPLIHIDPDGRKIQIVNKNYYRTLLDLGRVYATAKGREIIQALAKSEKTYTISGAGKMLSDNRYNRVSRRITYSGSKGLWTDGVWSEPFVLLSHELYHTYQHEKNLKYTSDNTFLANDYQEGAAMSFENYIRDVYQLGPPRRTQSGRRIPNPTSFPSGQERIDLSSVKVTQEIIDLNFLVHNNDSQDVQLGMFEQKDKTNVVLSLLALINITLEYIDQEGLQSVKILLR